MMPATVIHISPKRPGHSEQEGGDARRQEYAQGHTTATYMIAVDSDGMPMPEHIQAVPIGDHQTQEKFAGAANFQKPQSDLTVLRRK